METKKERAFSLELKSKRDLKNFTLTNGSNEHVLLEGNIGKLLQAKFAEGIVLEVVGEKGVVRIDLFEGELSKTRDKNSVETAQPDITSAHGTETSER
ncbi:MAG TPA: hypothetical protein VK536_01415 [Candidatus Limnocylindrales bacterium]|nr:hypothetical protein [Candidatus Limnocylindrales bacterium]